MKTDQDLFAPRLHTHPHTPTCSFTHVSTRMTLPRLSPFATHPDPTSLYTRVDNRAGLMIGLAVARSTSGVICGHALSLVPRT